MGFSENPKQSLLIQKWQSWWPETSQKQSKQKKPQKQIICKTVFLLQLYSRYPRNEAKNSHLYFLFIDVIKDEVQKNDNYIPAMIILSFSPIMLFFSSAAKVTIV